MSEFAEKRRRLSLDEQIKLSFDYYGQIWEKEKQKIPEKYRDPEKMYYKIEMIAKLK